MDSTPREWSIVLISDSEGPKWRETKEDEGYEDVDIAQIILKFLLEKIKIKGRLWAMQTNLKQSSQVFHTAVATLQSDMSHELFTGSSQELQQVMETPAFECMLQAVHLLSERKKISELEAARELIKTFKKIDRLWTQHVLSGTNAVQPENNLN
jgi:glycyl-tRNA synthetase alpha subunit